jgi:hypothetical protein
VAPGLASAGGPRPVFDSDLSHEAPCFIDTVVGDAVADGAVIGRAA